MLIGFVGLRVTPFFAKEQFVLAGRRVGGQTGRHTHVQYENTKDETQKLEKPIGVELYIPEMIKSESSERRLVNIPEQF